MAYRVKIGADLTKDVRRLLTAQIGRAIGHLSGVLDGGGSAIHATRKSLKRCRSILRLVQPGLGSKSFRRHDHAFRSVARVLSHDRDREVMAETLTLLTATDCTGSDKAALAAAVDGLDAGRLNGFALQDTDDNIRAAIAMLQDAERDVHKLAIRDAGISTIAAGFAFTYAEGRKTLKAAYRTNDDEAFHTFRKTLQHHWRQSQLLKPVWPELMGVRITAARELSQLAGQDHDLSLLKMHFGDDQHPLDASIRGRVCALAAAEQMRLRTEAEPLARRLYAFAPGDMEQMILRLWPAASRLAKHRRKAAAPLYAVDEVIPLKAERLS